MIRTVTNIFHAQPRSVSISMRGFGFDSFEWSFMPPMYNTSSIQYKSPFFGEEIDEIFNQSKVFFLNSYDANQERLRCERECSLLEPYVRQWRASYERTNSAFAKAFLKSSNSPDFLKLHKVASEIFSEKTLMKSVLQKQNLEVCCRMAVIQKSENRLDDLRAQMSDNGSNFFKKR